jgi:hypothetical protein
MELKDCFVLAFGASGWAVAIVKLFTDLREDARKAREDERKVRQEEREEREAKARIAEKLAPFILELNGPKYLSLYDQIKRSTRPQAGLPVSEDDSRALREYPAKLEEVGALMLAGRLSQAEVYERFGEEVLTCHRATALWGTEDPHYWKVFLLLAEAMEAERVLRDAGRQAPGVA